MSDWKFPDPPNVAVFVTAHVAGREGPIVFVSHEHADGAWQFHSIVSHGEPKLISLQQVVEIDPTIAELFDLP